jgi:hypothetical protein
MKPARCSVPEASKKMVSSLFASAASTSVVKRVTRCARPVLQLVVVAPGQNGIRHQPQVVADLEAALIADGLDRADEVLVGAHASGDAVHDDADSFGFHKVSSRFQV